MTTTDASEVRWDLEPLVDGRGPEGVDALLDQADGVAERLAASKGRIAEMDAAEFADLLEGIAELRELTGRAGNYAQLWFSTDTQDPRRGALMQKVEERTTEIGTKLLFFELEWAALDDAHAQKLLDDPALANARHHLEVQRRLRDHLLSEPEERVLAEKAVTGRAAWVRLFNEHISAVEATIDGDSIPLDAALSNLLSPDRDLRQRTADAVTEALEPGLRTRGFIYNTLAADKATDDRLRGFSHWLEGFNISQEASDEAVAALVAAVRERYDLPQRWYDLKRRLLGLEKLAHYDRLAGVSQDDVEFGWDEARTVVLDCYDSFSTELGDITRRFFDENWIDAPAVPGKTTGAFCAPTVPSVHPYVLLNYTGKRRDVMTLAHELGHGVHQYLGAKQGIWHHTTPLTMAEVASVFGETITFNRLWATADSDESRFSLLTRQIEDAISTVFRQVAFNQFEDRSHNARRNEGELSLDRFAEIWMETQGEMLGPAFDLSDDYHAWWSYIPHFIHVPGYVYAYAFGMLLALSVYRRYEERGDEFVPLYLEMLGAGGSRSPEDLAAIVDCDLTDPGFWHGGLALIERDIERAEETSTTRLG
ncbi:MAG TPA: M3 family oligoendopeptidase [Actinomycetota bacterium]|nr:M3 family oligoendopeptidase [Actinomycetota bacterium]